MNKPKSRTKSSLPAFLDRQTNEVLEPIYSKVDLLKKELEIINRHQKEAERMQQYTFNKTWKQQFLEIGIDRDLQIEKERKFRDSQSKVLASGKAAKKEQPLATASSWQDHTRNKTKSLINFLAQNKTTQKRDAISSRKQVKQPGQEDELPPRDDKFEPLGEQYKKQRHYQDSLKSQTQSLSSSRHDSSSLQSSSALGLRKESSKKYLRKGTRVRQILMRQLQTPDERGSSASSLTYLKDYDQWVPSALVEEKKVQLQTFMNIIYGEKKSQKVQAVNLNTVQLIYL